MITKEQWQAIEEHLSGVSGKVKFKLDGHILTVDKTLASETRLVYMIYINGQFKGSWTTDPVWDFANKVFYKGRPNIENISPMFKSFKMLKRHYSKLEGLEVESIG